MFFDHIYLDVFIRIVLIILCSAAIGINRGMRNHFAGLKTHILVGLGSGLSFIAPMLYFYFNQATFDPFRMSAQVISGLGFLGAGTIIKSGLTIRGLTTAASLWLVGILGITIASGAVWLGIIVTLFITFILFFGNKIDFTKRTSTKNIICSIKNFDENFRNIDKFMKENVVLNGKYTILEYYKVDDYTVTTIVYEIVHRKTELATNEIMQTLAKFDSVLRIDSTTEIERTNWKEQ
ncbi:MAG: MgtC/SapB family protein [Erysipelotrichaceae bacterium]